MSERAVRITLEYEQARVPLRHRRLVEPLLSAPTVRVRADGGVTTLSREWLRAGAPAGKHFAFPAKYTGVVVPALEALGHRVTVVSVGRGRLLAPVLTGLPADAPVCGLFRAPGAEAGALVRYAGAATPGVLLRQLLTAYPGRRVLVVAVNRGHAAALVRALAPVAGRPVITGREFLAGSGGAAKVVVTSVRHLERAQPHDFDLVIVPDARPLVGAPPALADGTRQRYQDYRLARHWWVPAFGLVPAAMTLSPAERLGLGALFGPEVRVGGPPVAAVVVRAEADPTAPPAGLPDPIGNPRGFRRAAVWENHPRTAWVAGLAAAEAAANPAARVLVLAEGPQAPYLAAALGGWPVVGIGHAGPAPARAVVTDVWAALQRPLPADLVVDARGAGPVDLPGFPPRAAGTVVLVDAGLAGPAGRRLTARRRDRYRGRGWGVVGPAR